MVMQRNELIPNRVRRVTIILTKIVDLDDEGAAKPPQYTATFNVELAEDRRELDKTVTGNLVPEMTQAQIDMATNFVDLMFAKAEQELLP
jgi:hypothetical protein